MPCHAMSDALSLRSPQCHLALAHPRTRRAIEAAKQLSQSLDLPIEGVP
jgi:hypothetical protein